MIFRRLIKEESKVFRLVLLGAFLHTQMEGSSDSLGCKEGKMHRKYLNMSKNKMKIGEKNGPSPELAVLGGPNLELGYPTPGPFSFNESTTGNLV